MWPWSYDKCDGSISDLEAKQQISSCSPEPGFGLHPHQGRGAPEIGSYYFIEDSGELSHLENKLKIYLRSCLVMRCLRLDQWRHSWVRPFKFHRAYPSITQKDLKMGKSLIHLNSGIANFFSYRTLLNAIGFYIEYVVCAISKVWEYSFGRGCWVQLWVLGTRVRTGKRSKQIPDSQVYAGCCLS